MKNISKIMLGFAAGAALGAVVGILFSPVKGKDLRKKMTDKGKKIVDEVKGKFKSRVNEVKEMEEEFA